MDDAWAIVPYLNRPDLTEQAVKDLLAQEGCNMRVLVIQQGLEPIRVMDRVLIWKHWPPLLSLASAWNRALDFCWSIGAEEVMVCNNDIRLNPWTWAALKTVMEDGRPQFVSGVGVTAEQFNAITSAKDIDLTTPWGGPDFSCYMISKECHGKYRFDENLIPAFCEDLDMHRRMMLGGDGDRIFSVNVPYLHLDKGSNTLKSMPEDKRIELERQIAQGSRAYYARKWGGGANQETFREPFSGHAQAGVKTNELFEVVRNRWNAS